MQHVKRTWPITTSHAGRSRNLVLTQCSLAATHLPGNDPGRDHEIDRTLHLFVGGQLSRCGLKIWMYIILVQGWKR